ncbi:MAG: putative porin [Lentisphaerae bacterium]|nr:putative porin [Lentisphaerota bacterium]
MRVRYENIDKEGDAVRARERFRARLGVEAKVNDEVTAGIGFRTGGNDPISGNQTMGDGFTSKDIALELGYVAWAPAVTPGATLIGGKMSKPFFQVSDLVWDGDLNPEGAALRYKLPLGPANLLVNGAALVVTERSKDSDTYIYTGQAGVDVKTDAGIKMLAGVSYYYYDNMQDFGVIDWTDSFKGYGNTVKTTRDDDGKVTKAVYANEYRELEFMASIGFDCPLTGLPWNFYGNYVRNTEADDDDTGYLAGVKLGAAKTPHSFELGYNYRHLEADAVVGAMADSDSWGGGTNGKGHKLMVAYQISKNWTLGASYFINEAGIRDGDTSKDYKRLQLDLAAKF